MGTYAIEILRRQTVPPDRIYVMNDGSSDNTGKILREYEKQGIVEYMGHEMEHSPHLFTDKFNHSQHRVMFHSMTEADYIMCMDADLVVEKDYVERIVKYMQRDNVKISAGRVLELRHIMPYEAGMVIDVEWLKQYISEKPSTSTLGLINQIVVSSGYRVATYVDVQMWVLYTLMILLSD